MSVITEQLSDLTYFRGRVALAEILNCLGIGAGDLVAVQAFTCVAVPEAIMAAGATPYWIDVEENSVNMSPTALKEAWCENIKAVVVQHTFGVMADMPGLAAAIPDGVPVIEDCCHTFSSSLAGQQAGTFGIASFYSFEWGKPIVLGAGGAAIANEGSLKKALTSRLARFSRPSRVRQAKLVLQYIGFSILYRPGLYWFVKGLFNRLSRMGLAVGNYNPIDPDVLSDDFSCRMSARDEKRLKKRIGLIKRDDQRRREIAGWYDEILREISDLRPVVQVQGAENVLVRYPVIVTDKPTVLRRAKGRRIEAAEWYNSPVHPLGQQEWVMVGYEAGSCPNAEDMARNLISFPMGKTVKRHHADKIRSLFEQ